MSTAASSGPSPEVQAEGRARLVVAVVSSASLGSQAAHEVDSGVGQIAQVVRMRSLAELVARASRQDEPAMGTVALIIVTDEVGNLDDVAALVAQSPALASARLILLTERTDLQDLGRAIDDELVREVVAVPWTPGAIGERAAAQTWRWMQEHLSEEELRRQAVAEDADPDEHLSPLLSALSHSTDALTREFIAACEQVLGPRPRLHLPAGVRLTHQGQAVAGVYIVINGAVALTRETRVGEVTLHHATTGRIIGLVALASQGRASVTSTTTTDVELILLSIEQLDRSLRENPVTEQTLAALLIGSLTTRLARSEILQVEKIELVSALEEERKQATMALAALEQARLELLAQERFATLGELAAGVAHELNNPVAALEGANKHLRRDLSALLARHPDGELINTTAAAARTRPAASTRQERADRRALEAVVGDRELARRLVTLGIGAHTDPAEVRALAANEDRLSVALLAASIGREARNATLATDRIRGLVSSLSAYVRPEGEMSQDVDVREVLEDSLRLTAHRLHGVELVREYEEVPTVPGRSGELAQVWTNILSNAADALAARTAKEPTGTCQPCVHLRALRQGEAVRVEVEDNGPGIDPAVLPHIFEPRFTTKHGQVRFGLGLGMGLAKSVVDSHGGTIEVVSQPGRTCVTVVLQTTAPKAPGRGRSKAVPRAEQPPDKEEP
ncbi:Nitrogen regulation protein NR(II) [Actinomyces bovis]|uniref:histidine kinase n=1 Tax=Actinomyces bovis TaxID=1658 RepID=A0ABY1VQQ3_9ACTO|nr:ATP-binding protein [Actinomyces bovis]SPT55012.1 Nitrogen regulation protein NR(II) [Actinomyces bovis]VEG56144.1 Nitrogen regulation protein NR(II) [Actinomyces israelii]